jgi:hypothetical protein
MKLLVYFIIITIGITNGYCQNLVPNPSFEKINCMTVGPPFTIYGFCDWFRPKGDIGTPDGFENDSLGQGNNFPCQRRAGQSTFIGNVKTPFGKYFMGALMYYTQGGQTNFVENASSKLAQNLIANKNYKIGFYVKFGDRSKYVINNIGLVLSNDTLNAGLVNSHIIYTVASVSSSVQIGPGNGWTKVEKMYKATGNEKFLTLGRFTSDAQSIISVNPNYNLTDTTSCLFVKYGGYYLFDSVYVQLADNTPIGESPIKADIRIFPSPSSGEFTLSSEDIDIGTLTIVSVTGEEISFFIKESNKTYHVIALSTDYRGIAIVTFKGKQDAYLNTHKILFE